MYLQELVDSVPRQHLAVCCCKKRYKSCGDESVSDPGITKDVHVVAVC